MDDGEAAPALVPTTIHIGDLVTLFKSKGELAGHGTLTYFDGKPEEIVVLCVGGSVVHAEPGDLLTIEDRRALFPGQMVVSASDPGGQAGVVTGVDTVLDLVDLDAAGGVTAVAGSSIPPDELLRVTTLSLGDYVTSGPWLGRVVELSVDADVLFDDGAACRVFDAQGKLRPSIEAGRPKVFMREFGNGSLYPGRRVRAAAPVLEAARWLDGHFKRGVHVTGTVAKVKLAYVIVDWVASAHLGAKQQHLVQASTPPHQQNPRDLTFFRSDRQNYWAVEDRCFFHDLRRHGPRATAGGSSSSTSSSAAPVLEPAKLPPHPGKKTFFKRNSRAPRRRIQRRRAAFERTMSVASTRTTADVVWQDGTRQRDVPSVSLVPFATHLGSEFTPGERVIESADDNAAVADADVAAARRLGVVRSLNCKDRTARVAWLKPSGEVEREETVSTYELDRDYDHNFFYGDVVVRRLVPSESSGGETSNEAADRLSWIGEIVDLCDAYIQVKWGDGSTSKVLPHEIEVVHEQHIYVMRLAMGDWVDANAAEEDKPEEPAATAAAAARIQHQRDGSATDEIGGGDSASAAETMGRLGAFIRALIQLPGEVLARGKRYVVGGASTVAAMAPPSSVAAATVEVHVEEPTEMEVVAVPASCGEGGVDIDGSAAENGKAADDGDVASDDEDNSFHFTRFEVVQQNPPDHHFLDDTKEQGAGGGKKWTKRVQKEWKILQNNLPETIYVRVFEDRMDLLRAAMVGAAGTPYQDGLFFFDVHLPPSYPDVPPQVYYHSFGLHLNPNLYPSGRVCLSLLDTFDGEGDERWSPANSSILQVLVSIQGLVLTAQPYYNEAGYEELLGRPEGARNAPPYAENAYLLTLRTMLHLLRRPPVGFEELVGGHFRRHGRFVLRACEAYLKGCPVGTLDADARTTAAESGQPPCSVGLRVALTSVVPRLVEAFTKIDAEGCEEFDQLRDSLCGAGGLVPPPCSLAASY